MVVPHSELLPAAVEVAKRINLNSPDSVQSTKKALVLSQSYGYEEVVQSHAQSLESKRVYNGANIKVYCTNCDMDRRLLSAESIVGGIEGICRGRQDQQLTRTTYLSSHRNGCPCGRIQRNCEIMPIGGREFVITETPQEERIPPCHTFNNEWASGIPQ